MADAPEVVVDARVVDGLVALAGDPVGDGLAPDEVRGSDPAGIVVHPRAAARFGRPRAHGHAHAKRAPKAHVQPAKWKPAAKPAKRHGATARLRAPVHR